MSPRRTPSELGRAGQRWGPEDVGVLRDGGGVVREGRSGFRSVGVGGAVGDGGRWGVGRRRFGGGGAVRRRGFGGGGYESRCGVRRK